MIDFEKYLPSCGGVWWSQASAEPEPLVNQFLDQAGALGNVRAFCGLTWNNRLSQDLPPSVTIQSYGALGELRHLSRQGSLEVVPCHYSSLPRMFQKGQLPNDLGLVQVSPPDAHGFVTLGIGVEYVADAIPHTATLIAEVNHQMPPTVGSIRLSLDAFAATIETDRPLREAVPRQPDERDRRIAAQVAPLIEDGDTIQVGVGTLPNAVLKALVDHVDLGLHSGILTDGVLGLIDRGVLTGARKEIDPGLSVAGTAIGSTATYARIPDMPVEFRATSYTHSPAVLSKLRSFVSINSAIEVDLLGQVGAEIAAGYHVGAVGGQVDFSRAAALTGSRSIIALRSEVSGKTTIVPTLRSGVVTTARADVDAVVTEHGVADLSGCTVTERARRLIQVAAPQHREDLERSLKAVLSCRA